MKKHIVLSFLLASFLVSCGGGGDNSKSESANENLSTAKLYDSLVVGVNYEKNTGESGKTSEDGFTYKKGDKITFKIGGITLGEQIDIKSDKIFLTDLFKLDKNNIDNTNVIKTAQLLQSLDNAKGDDKIIIDETKITSDIKTSNKNIKDISDIKTELKLQDVVTEEQAKAELQKTYEEHFKNESGQNSGNSNENENQDNSSGNENNGSGDQITTNKDIFGFEEEKVVYYSKKLPYNGTDYKPIDYPDSINPRPEYTDPKNIYLQDLASKIIPQTSHKILKRFPKTFGYLEKAGEYPLGIGFQIGNTNHAAQVNMDASWFNLDPNTNNQIPKREFFSIGMQIGYAMQNDKLENKNLQDFASVISHEIFHAFQSEVNTAGMRGTCRPLKLYDKYPNGLGLFPGWFKEGLASVIGGHRGHHDTLKYYVEIIKPKKENGFKYNCGTESNKVSRDQGCELNDPIYKLEHYNKKGFDEANYGAGYLACMYLGSLIGSNNNTLSTDPKIIASGLDELLSSIASGLSFDKSLKKLTKNKFATVEDFRVKFSELKESDIEPFIKEIIKAYGNNGLGSILNEKLSDEIIYTQNENSDPKIFKIEERFDKVKNIFHPKVVVCNGGGVEKDGLDKDGNEPLMP